MTVLAPQLTTRFAQDDTDIRAVQALRHRVFVDELGAQTTGASVEADGFDDYAHHLMVLDKARAAGDQVVGVYRLLDQTQAERAGGFSSAAEYDLTPLLSSGRRLLELSRSCLHPDYRSGLAMVHLWQALDAHIAATGTDILFGVASFHGTDPSAFAQALSLLHAEHLAPETLRPVSKYPAVFEATATDRKVAMRQMPSLIKAYLKLGGKIGQGAYVDRKFNTTDVCMVLDVAQSNAAQRALYQKGRG